MYAVRKRLPALLLAGTMLLTMTGCGSVFEDEYYYEEPFSGEIGNLSSDAIEIRNLSMLKTAITGMISRHEERGDYRLSNYKGNPSEDLAEACYEIKSTNPLGVYAVETLSYETNYVVSYYTATIYITYKRSEEEIRNVQYIDSREAMDRCVFQAVDSFTPETVIRIFSPEVDSDYLRMLVKRHCYENPVAQIREPAVTVESYPADGPNRIYDLRLDYDFSQQQSSSMSRELGEEVRRVAASLAETETGSALLALKGTEYLSSLCGEADGGGSYPDTAYGAFLEKSADSKGLALAFRALCSSLDIGCIVVEGSVGSKGGEPHFWNIIELEGSYYHVDVSAFAGEDPGAAFLLNDDSLWGTYLWDTEAYPACDGALRYADLIPPEEIEEPAPEEEPEEGTEEEEPEAAEVPEEETTGEGSEEEKNERENGILP